MYAELDLQTKACLSPCWAMCGAGYGEPRVVIASGLSVDMWVLVMQPCKLHLPTMLWHETVGRDGARVGIGEDSACGLKAHRETVPADVG